MNIADSSWSISIGNSTAGVKSLAEEVNTRLKEIGFTLFECSPLPLDVSNASLAVYVDSYGAVVIATCLNGYRMKDGGKSRSNVCAFTRNNTGKWMNVTLHCQGWRFYLQINVR
jgi:hypothetical protein